VGIADSNGNVMTTDRAVDFFVLPGDANRDRKVDIGDFSTLATNFNRPGNYFLGDFNYSGTVEIGDFAILASRFNQELPPPAGAAAAASAVAPRPAPRFADGRIDEDDLLGVID
jgi:hypothetical protein